MEERPTQEYSAHVDDWVVRRIRPAPMEASPEPVDRRAAAYLRVSTGRQPTSLALQRRELERYARSQGFDIVAVYEDLGKSGTTLEKRSGLSRLLFDVVTGRANFAAFWFSTSVDGAAFRTLTRRLTTSSSAEVTASR